MQEISEIAKIVERLRNSIDAELANIKTLKSTCIGKNEFEKCASIRDFEKQVIAFRERISPLG